ncbi:DUF7269 family protein [Halobiforma nitratireducens]|uniref:Uncharacterized protein n=1 Tax=Halobiforma nitratireducens JCM 10879 TaxID=1227454 RepID=M0LVZ9_9EURY|nr:hypothetical protein [Halobiforma nitratireducens]EMA37338.1 hypothetical protein C446_10795 [Halobiforma nitratireducens JCM 10879]
MKAPRPRSRSGSRSSTSIPDIGDRLRELFADPERAGIAIVVAGGLVAVATVLVGGFFPRAGVLIDLLYPLAILLPVIGGLIALVGFKWAWTGGTDDGGPDPLIDGESPERGTTRSSRRVARDTGWLLGRAAADRYQCRSSGSTVEVRDRLIDGAVRVLASRGGLEADAAREAIRTGEWTDDPVAAAFLSPRLRQPPGERLRGAVDPGSAYTRRVRRTLSAIEAVETDNTSRTPADSRESTDGDEPARAEVTG